MKINVKEGNYAKLGVQQQAGQVTFTFCGEKEDICFVVLVRKSDMNRVRVEVPESFCLGSLRSITIVGLDVTGYVYYYEINGKRHASPHLFLITEIEQGILLSSYEIPKGEDKNTFSYDSMKNVDYSKLEKSEKFTPALYHEKDGIWEGGSTSQFSPVMTFKLWEKFSNNFLEVSESMEVNGKRTFGYDEPIIYKRV